MQSQPEEEDEAEEEEAEELGHTETYADYVPSKCEWPGSTRPWDRFKPFCGTETLQVTTARTAHRGNVKFQGGPENLGDRFCNPGLYKTGFTAGRVRRNLTGTGRIFMHLPLLQAAGHAPNQPSRLWPPRPSPP